MHQLATAPGERVTRCVNCGHWLTAIAADANGDAAILGDGPAPAGQCTPHATRDAAVQFRDWLTGDSGGEPVIIDSALPGAALIGDALRVVVSLLLSGTDECGVCGAAPGEPCRATGDVGDWDTAARVRDAETTAAELDAAEAAATRLPGPFPNLPGPTPLTVAAGPGRHPEAWRPAASGVWFAYAGEPTEDLYAERITAGELTRRLTGR